MNRHLNVLLVVVASVAISDAEVLEMNINADDCGETFSVRTWNEYTLFAPGDFTGSVCSYTFMGQAKGNCLGLCYDVKKKSFFKPNSANLTMKSGSHLQVFNHDNLSLGPWCSEDLNMTVTLTVAEGYEYDNKHPGYGFTVDIYNKCGKGDSITFEEALEHIDGYHHGEVFHENVQQNLIHGIIVGVCLACTFLIILGITVCYYKRRMGTSRRMSKPTVTFKQKRTENVTSKQKSGRDPEVTMKY